MSKFQSIYTECLEDVLKIAELAMKKDPKSKQEWDEVYRSSRYELYKTKGKIVPIKRGKDVGR